MSCYFGPILTSPLPCPTLSNISGPLKVRHTSRTPPIFSSTCIHTYVLVLEGFDWGVLSGVFLEGFVQGGFCPSPLLSEYIHYNRKPNITFNFRFHMYENIFKSVTLQALGPPVTVKL